MRVDLEGGGRDDRCRARQLGGSGRSSELAPLALHAQLVGFERGLGVLVDHRADVGRVVERIADVELVAWRRRSMSIVLGDVLLHEQHAQRRAALAGAVEGGAQHIAHHLLGQRRWNRRSWR